jgi:predicted HD phosphohydrolase
MADTVKFTAMKDGDRDDYEFLTAHEIDYAAKTGGRLLDALVQLDEGLSGYKITRLGHSLQAATRAWRDGADTDWIACALLHDIGDIYAPYNHDEYAASILKPFVREQCTWVVEKHGDFQRLYYAHHLGGNRHARDRFAGHAYFDDCDQFCERWDQSSFDPDYERCRSNSSGLSCSKSSPARPTTHPSFAPASACLSSTPKQPRQEPEPDHEHHQQGGRHRRRCHRRRLGGSAAAQRHRRVDLRSGSRGLAQSL